MPGAEVESPLSHGQRALWFLDRLAPGNAAYVVAGAVRVRGELDAGALRRSLDRLAERHGALRTTFHEGGGGPAQRVHERLAPDFEVVEGAAWDEEELARRLSEFAYRSFDLDRGPLVRLGVFERAGEERLLVLALHHIVSDFWSLGVLVRELGALYGEETGGAAAELGLVGLTYGEWVSAQEEMLAGEEGERLWRYWREALQGVPLVLDLPGDRPRPAVQGYRGAAVELCLGKEKTRLLGRLGRDHGATLAMSVLAGFGALLGRWAGQERVLVGMPTTGRRSREVAGVVGYLVNPVAVEIDLRGDPVFGELVERVRDKARGAFERQDFPLPLLAERLQPERDPSRPPLFQVAAVLQKGRRSGEDGIAALWAGASGAQVPFGRLVLESVALRDPGAQFDLTLGLAEWRGELVGRVQYDRDLFDGATVRRLAVQLERLLGAALAAPEARVSELPLLGEGERQQVVVEWNDTSALWAEGAVETVLAQFEAWVQRQPEAPAVAMAGQVCSYGELDARAEELGERLRGLGVGAGQVVGICLERSPELVATVLAAGKCGAAYLPLDPAHPAERLRWQLADAGVRVLVTKEQRAGIAPAAVATLTPRPPLSGGCEGDGRGGQGVRGLDRSGSLGLGGLAYVIYTSGSTGRPKGTLLGRRGLSNLVAWHRRTYGLSPASRTTLIAGVGFDASVWEIWPALASGASLWIPPAEVVSSPPALAAWIAEREITCSFLPTPLGEAVLEQGLPENHRLEILVVGGDRLHRSAPAGSRFRLVNIYGPTECTVLTNWWEVPAGSAGMPPIGRPISGIRTLLLDRTLQPMPPGFPGEVYIGGEGLAWGYLDRPELTAASFLPDPFGEGGGNGGLGARLYRAGDLARFRPDGCLEFLGRADQQVKIRGHRIELGEIEAVLASHPDLREVAVLVWGEGRDARLAAYVVSRSNEAVSPDRLRTWLSERLPAALVPSGWVTLDALPLTPNGKVDRRALAALERPASDENGDWQAPATPTEEVLAAVWCDLLHVRRVGRGDHFFHLGGHSLLAAQLASRIRSAFGVELPLAQLFAAPTLAALAHEVEAGLGSGGARTAPPLVARGRSGPAPLSFAQERLWFLDQLEPGSTVYNVPGGLRLRGALHVAALAAALRSVVQRHEALRTAFQSLDGQPVQVIAADPGFGLPVVDLTGISIGRRAAELAAMARAEALRPFDLTRAPLLRARLVRLGPDEHALLLTLHHIVSDGWSLGVLVRELGVCYRSFLAGRAPDLAPLPVQYADYAAWQREWLASGEWEPGEPSELDRQLEFWRGRLAGLPEALELPADLPRPAVQSFRGGQLPVDLGAPLSAAVRELARRHDATPFLVLLAAFAFLLSRLTGQEDVAVGSPVAGRTRLETEGLIGLFVNTLVLRCDLSGDPPFREVLSRVRETVLAASAHQDLPFEKLVEALAPERDRSRSPLFQVMLTHQASPLAGLALAGLEVEQLTGEGETAKFDLTLALEERDGGIAGALEYSRDLFHRATARRLAEQLGRVLAAAVARPDLPVSRLPLLGEAERQQIQVEWTETGTVDGGIGSAAALHELFEARARRAPRAVALVCGGRETTYAQLDARADRLAARLRSLGVGPEVPVGVCSERTPALVAALLGVLKAGGAYVPLDPTYPGERLAWMLEGCRVVVAPAGLRDRLPATAAAWLDLTDVAADGSPAPARAAEIPAPDRSARAAAGNLAYVIYTSGSTGRPKGVAIEHRSAVALVRWAASAFAPAELSRVLAATSVCFDLSVFELFVPLCLGGSVVLVRDALALLEDAGAAPGVTLINTVPSAMAELVRAGRLPSTVRTVNLAGEPLTGTLARAVLAAKASRLLNLYGPSEDTTYSTMGSFERDEAGEPTIGRPLPGTRALVLDRRQRPVPVGVPGELCLAGEGLARGYLGRPDLTAERFVPSPDAAAERPGERMYRTGDLARWLPDGRLAFLGRLDHQVKVRGFRIELGEVEAALRACPGVREAVVLARRDGPGGEPQLVAYLTSHGAAPPAGELRSALASRLPAYMVPAAFVALPAFLLSPNGKIDRRALPAPHLAGDRPASRPLAAPPITPIEEGIARIWAEVLGLPVSAIGADGHFFHLGGHSLVATRVAARIRAGFGVDLPLASLFAAPTVAALAAEVERRQAPDRQESLAVPRIPLLPRQPDAAGRVELPASFAQERLWFLERLHPGSPVYNMSAALHLRGPLSVASLAAALDGVVRRHEVLRTTLAERAGAPFQVVAPPCSRPLPVIDLTALPPAVREDAAHGQAQAEARRPFELGGSEGASLLRASLVRLVADEHLVLVSMHHAVSDLWSIGVFQRELAALYAAACGGGLPGEGAGLPALPVQYGDFAAWQRGRLASGALAGEREAWWQRLAGAPAALELPTDRPRPEVQRFRGRQLGVRLPAVDPVRTAAFQGGGAVTPFMVYLTAWSALLGRLSGQADLVIGTPVAGRTHPLVEGLIGFFVNLLPLRVDLAGDPDLGGLLGRVRETTLHAFSHQELPFDKLVEDLALPRDPSRTPLFQVLLALQNAPAAGLELPGLAVTPLAVDTGTSRFDLSLALAEDGPAGLAGTAELDTDLFDTATVLRLLRQLEVLLGALAADPAGTLGKRVSDAPLLAAGERAQLVLEWNDTAFDLTPRCLHATVAGHAARTPQAPALDYGGERLTYRELDRRANRLARLLRGLGVGPEERVGVCLERSADLIVTLLAVLKAGGSYVPLDPDYPAERLAYMMADADIRALVTRRGMGVAAPAAAATVLLDELSRELANPLPSGDDGPLPDLVDPANAAYVIYTSGSTGRPKGVVVSHASIHNLIAGCGPAAARPGDRVGHVSSISFDAATYEIWATLLGGACLVGIPREVVLAPRRFAAFLAEQRVTILLFATALFHQVAAEVPDAFRSLRLVMFGGEAVDPRHPRAVLRHEPPERLVQVYGPTETTVFSAVFAIEEVPDGATGVPLGRPIGNTAVYVVDRHQRPLPPGVLGELALAGAGLARGYSGRPELTAERFVPLPTGLVPGAPGDAAGSRLYRTGDRVRQRPDGLLEFLGRMDNQVKLRGFRIELGEIETALLEHPDVQEALVLVLGAATEADRRLAACVVPAAEAADRAALPGALREWLGRRVPGYMVPSAFAVLDRFPISAIGKIDRTALAALATLAPGAGVETGRPARPPATPTEEAMVHLWTRLLEPVRPGQHVGVEASFFELGGHSLLAVQLLSQVRERFGVEVAIQALFTAPTVAGLAAEVDRLRALGGGTEPDPLQKIPRLPRQPDPGGRVEAPASFAQERLWFLDQLEGGSAAYNVPLAVRVEGRLDLPAFAAALAEIVRRHESLRTTFAAVRARPVQVIAPPAAVAAAGAPLLPSIDLAALPEARRDAAVRALAEAEARRPFDLARGPLLRAALLRLGPDLAVLLLDIHHIVSDGWSMGVLLQELAALYEASGAEKASPLAELPVQYADYAAWQRSRLAGEVLEAEIGYWRERLAGAPAVLDLPGDRPRPAVQSRRGGHRFVRLDPALAAGLGRLGRAADATLYMVLLAGFQALLARLTGGEDLPVGSPVAGRDRAELDGLIGFFVNMVVLRGDLAGRPGFGELLGRVRATALEALEHQALPFEKLVEALRPERDLGHAPLVQVLFGLQNTPLGALRLPGVTLAPLQVESGQAKFDLALALAESGGGLAGGLEFSRDLFDAATAERIFGQYAALLAGAVAEPERPFQELPLLSAAECQQTLREWSGRAVEPAGGPLLPALFEQQAARRPDATALQWDGGSLSYGELNARANRVAHHLRALGVGPEVLVGVCLERSPRSVAGLLGTFKSGGAYLPLDPALPAERLQLMAADAGLRFLLTERRLAEEMARVLPADSAGGLAGVRRLLIEECWETGPAADPPAGDPGHAAYVIYTSGSTGRPKGVVIPAGALGHRMRWFRDAEIVEGERFLHKITLSFDASLGELFGGLVAGQVMTLAPPGWERDLPALIRLMTEMEITTVGFTASTLAILLQDPALAGCVSLRKLMTGAEAVPAALPERVARLLEVDLFNRYGPTETTIVVISGRCARGGADRVVPLGRPIADAEVVLLDRELQPVPAGVPGELCIGGPVLARGYLGRPDLTAASFVPHAFDGGLGARQSDRNGGLGARLYRSGDLARWRVDGALEFVGRIDQQVKIRGFRVELGEIESLLVKHPSVQDVAVVVRGEGAAHRLVAFVVPRPGADVAAAELQAALAAHLPGYMVPAGFVFLDVLPTLPTGKVDRKALLAVEDAGEGAGRARAPYEPPGTPVEELLAGIWSEVLGVERIGIHDDFFDLGGHSLQVTQILLRVKEELAVELPVRDFFENPTVAGLALLLAEQLTAALDEDQLAVLLADLE